MSEARRNLKARSKLAKAWNPVQAVGGPGSTPMMTSGTTVSSPLFRPFSICSAAWHRSVAGTSVL